MPLVRGRRLWRAGSSADHLTLTRPDHQRRRRGQPQRAGAGDDKHGDAKQQREEEGGAALGDPVWREGTSGAGAPPRGKGEQRRQDGERHEDGADAVGVGLRRERSRRCALTARQQGRLRALPTEEGRSTAPVWCVPGLHRERQQGWGGRSSLVQWRRSTCGVQAAEQASADCVPPPSTPRLPRSPMLRCGRCVPGWAPCSAVRPPRAPRSAARGRACKRHVYQHITMSTGAQGRSAQRRTVHTWHYCVMVKGEEAGGRRRGPTHPNASVLAWHTC